MPINRRQKTSWRDYADIWNVQLGPDGEPQYSPVPTYSNVICKFVSTTEFDVPSVEGRKKEINIFTADHYHFLPDQDVADGYYIRLRTSGHPLALRFWVVEGNSQVKYNYGRRRMNSQMVYARIAAAPSGVV